MISTPHNHYKRWTAEEDKFLLDNYERVMIHKLAEIMNRSSQSIYGRYHSLKNNKTVIRRQKTVSDKNLRKIKKINIHELKIDSYSKVEVVVINNEVYQLI
jgi:hypothetical protein